MEPYTIIDLVQGSEDWKNYRRTKITATDTAKIMNLSPFCTPLQLWEEKLGLREPQFVNDAMKEGSRLEEEALDFLNNISETQDTHFEPKVLISNQYPFMMASLDAINDLGEIVEIKCGKSSHEMAKNGIIPDYYMAQVQKQIFVAGTDKATYFSFRSTEDTYEITIKRDDAFIEKMIEAEKEFYCCLMNFTPPPAIDRDFVKRDDDAWYFRSKEWKDVKRQLKELEEKEELLRADLIKMCDGQSSQGNGVRISKSIRKGNVDYSSIDLLKNVDLEAYRKKPSTYYRITDNDQ